MLKDLPYVVFTASGFAVCCLSNGDTTGAGRN
jgi:hypothetical protein